MKKNLVKLNQENKAVELEWEITQKYLAHVSVNEKDKKEKTSNLQAQKHQVGTSR